MKKLFLILTCCITIISCSSNDKNNEQIKNTEISTVLKNKLVGSWKFVGIYNYFDIDQSENPHIEYYENGNVLQFDSDNTFTDDGNINNNGNYNVYVDSVLTRLYTTSQQNYDVKIVKLNDSIFDLTCTNENNIGTCPCEAYRYIKVN